MADEERTEEQATADVASGEEANAEDRLRGMVAGLRDKEWIADLDFYRCIVSLGDQDSATLRAASGTVADKVLSLVGTLAPLVATAVGAAAGDEATGLRVFLELCAPETREAVWSTVADIFGAVVSTLDLPEWQEATGHPIPALPAADAPSADRIAFVQALPLKVVARILAGAAYHLGN